MPIKSKLAILMLALILDDQVHAGYIFGGHEAVPHSRPYMVLLKNYKTNEFLCGGFLLNEDFIMTAAHCQANSYVALLGVHKSQEHANVQNITVEQVFPNENYNANDYSNDIMLLKLSSKAHFNKYVQPIHLGDGGDGSLPKSCATSGWGLSDKYPSSIAPVLMEVNVTLIANEKCRTYKKYCSEGTKGPREGDSGGPLVCEDGKAFGVVSAGSPEKPDGSRIYSYTKIPDYKKWIKSIFKKAVVSH